MARQFRARWMGWWRRFCEPRAITVRSHLANVGCGTTFHEAWDNFDLLPCAPGVRKLDLVATLSLPSSAYEAVYSSHVIEHLPRGLAPRVCMEFHRILKRGGTLRLVVPDLEGIASSYLNELRAAAAGCPKAADRHEWITMELLDQMTRSFSGGYMGRLWWSRPLAVRELIEERLGQEATAQLDQIDKAISCGQKPLQPNEVYQPVSPSYGEELKFRRTGEIHRWMYDRVSLKRLLEGAGFRDVRVCCAAESRIPDFASYNLDTDAKGRIRKPDSLFMEATT
jgi:predicted SAM-dependent methyltransferase